MPYTDYINHCAQNWKHR